MQNLRKPKDTVFFLHNNELYFLPINKVKFEQTETYSRTTYEFVVNGGSVATINDTGVFNTKEDLYNSLQEITKDKITHLPF